MYTYNIWDYILTSAYDWNCLCLETVSLSSRYSLVGMKNCILRSTYAKPTTLGTPSLTYPNTKPQRLNLQIKSFLFIYAIGKLRNYWLITPMNPRPIYSNAFEICTEENKNLQIPLSLLFPPKALLIIWVTLFHGCHHCKVQLYLQQMTNHLKYYPSPNSTLASPC